MKSSDNTEKEVLYETVLQKLQNTLESKRSLESGFEITCTKLTEKLDTKQKKEIELTNAFHTLRDGVISNAIKQNRSTNLDSLITEYKADEQKTRKDIYGMRLNLIKTKIQLKKFEERMKSKDKLDEELDMLGLEKLQSENEYLKSTLNHRQKEIANCKKKYKDNSSTISATTKMIEEIQSKCLDHDVKKKGLEDKITRCEKQLTMRTKKYSEIQKKSHLKSSEASNMVVYDYHISSKDEIENLTQKLENLKALYFDALA